jgi:predicted dehydrogenase
MASIGVGLIGVGQHGLRYARHIVSDIPELRLIGIARRNLELARAQAAELGCLAFGDHRELIAHRDVEAVIVVVPPTLHEEIVDAAADAKRTLLLEKPAAPNLEAGRRILRRVRQAGIAVMVAQTLRYNEVVRAVLEVRERIGRIHGIRLSQRFEPSRPGWIDDPEIAGGGIVLHTGVHSFDLMRLLSRMEGDRVSCELAVVNTKRTEDNFTAVIRLGGGAALASIAGSRATASRTGPIELAGEHGTLVGDHVLGGVHLVRGRDVTLLPTPEALPTVREILRDFARSLRSGASMPIPLEDGLRAVALAQACYDSGRSGTAVGVASIE